MKVLARIVVAAITLGVGSHAWAQTVILSCEEPEASALRAAPLGATRASERLTVNWAHGSTVFTDSGTKEGYIGGTGYLYCGFNATVGLHLIHKTIEDEWTGILLDHATGKILPAGEQVSFAPLGTRYFAATHENGLAVEKWYIYARDGSLLWKALAGMSERHPSADYEYIVATLSQPRWGPNGEFQATLTCAIGPAKPPTAVTLTRQSDGWVWLPKVSCPKARLTGATAGH